MATFEGVAAQVVFFLAEEDFDETRRVLFTAILRLLEDRHPIDWITIIRRASEISGMSHGRLATELCECVLTTTTAANSEYHAKELAQHARLERLKTQAAEAARSTANSVDDLTSMLNRAMEQAQAPDDEMPESLQEILIRRYNQLEAEREGKIVINRTYTGISRIDGKGGMRGGEFWVLGARPAHGKTALAWQISEYAARDAAEDAIVLVFSIEMTPEELAERSFSRATDLPASDIRAALIPNDAWAPMTRVIRDAEGVPLYVVRGSKMTVEKIRATCARARMKRRLALVVIDFIQLVRTTQHYTSRENEVSAVARELKSIAKDMDAPVLGLSQLSRKVEERANHEPMSSDLREGGDIESAADTILLIHRPFLYDENEDEQELRANTTKNRHGGTGQFKLRFLVQRSKFVDWNP
jgi:replicative DNA helicase